MKDKKLPYLLFISIIALICFCMFLPNFLTHRPVAYGTDLKPEQLFFNMEFTNLLNQFLKEGTLPFYSWSMFLGTNFYSSQTFYVMTDIFGWIGLLFHKINFFDKALLLEIMKFFISAYTMLALLKEMRLSKIVSWIGAISFAFSSWAIFYSGQLMFHSFYVFVPLYLLGIEHYLKYNKKILFIISTAILAFSNWYFFYTISFITPLYYIYRYYLINRNFKRFFIKTIRLIGFYFIGVFISGITLIPTLYYMSGNNRIGLISDLIFSEKQIYFHLLSAVFAPNYLYLYQNNVFETNWHVTRELCIWAGTFTSVGVLSLFAVKDKIYRNATLITYFFFSLILFFPISNAAIHGFSEPSFRWTFVLTIFNILTACYCLDHTYQIDKLRFFKIILCAIVFCIMVIPITSFVKNDTSNLFTSYKNQWILYFISAILILLYALIIIKEMKNKLILFLILTIAEFSLFGNWLYSQVLDKSERGTYDFTDEVIHVLQDNDGDLNRYLNYLDEDNYSQYYRVYVPHDSLYWYYSHNMSIAYQLNGLMTYDSTYAPSINKLKELAPQIVEYNSGMIFNIKDGNIMQFLNVKYAIVLNEGELPKNIEWKLIDSNYRGSMQVYENINYRPLGTTYDSVITYGQYKNNNYNINALNDFVLCEDKDFEEISSTISNGKIINLEEIYYGGNQLSGSCYSDSIGFMVITLPYDQGWKILVNGEEIKYYNVNGGFIGVPIQRGRNYIEMYFVPQGFKLGVICSGVGILIFITIFIFEAKSKNRKIRKN